MKLSKFWVVRDPSPESELGDILFSSDVNHFASYCIGTGHSQFMHERHAIYTDAAEAKKDAEARLKSRSSKTAERVVERFTRR